MNPRTPDSATSRQQEDPIRIKPGLVLIVEDSADDLDLTLRALRRNRIDNEIVVVKDGAEALDYLFGFGRYAGAAGERLPQLVLLDLKLPKVDGIQLLERVRSDQRTRDLCVVVLTSSDEFRDLSECERLGVVSYVRKTVDFIEFSQTIRRQWPIWMSQSEISEPSAKERGLE